MQALNLRLLGESPVTTSCDLHWSPAGERMLPSVHIKKNVLVKNKNSH